MSERIDPRLVRDRAVLVTPSVQDHRTVLVGVARERGGQAGLADAGLPGDAPRSGERPSAPVASSAAWSACAFVLTPDEHLLHGESWRKRDPHRRDRDRRRARRGLVEGLPLGAEHVAPTPGDP